jgi:hypothetical protein
MMYHPGMLRGSNIGLLSCLFVLSVSLQCSTDQLGSSGGGEADPHSNSPPSDSGLTDAGASDGDAEAEPGADANADPEADAVHGADADADPGPDADQDAGADETSETGPADADPEAARADPIEAGSNAADSAPFPGDFSCHDQPLPQSVDIDPFLVEGTTVGLDLGNIENAASALPALGDVTVEAFVTGSSDPVPAAVSSSSPGPTLGQYQLGIPNPLHQTLDGYLRGHIDMDGYLDTYFYPPKPLVVNHGQGTLLIVTQTDVDIALYLAIGVTPPQLPATSLDTQGILVVVVQDCAMDAIAGATVQSSAGTLKYLPQILDGTAPPKTDGTGVAILFQVPPGDVTVGASVGGVQLYQHTVAVVPRALTFTVVQP